MNALKQIVPGNSYFAAANGYSGFRSYFKEIFNSVLFTRIYVLKGGPGTGKSTLMKKILLHFQNFGSECEAIYCSSDPASLDGVIISHKGKRIAIIDGTAPHETDAKIPGAVDEIINLGKSWSPDTLIHKRKEITALNEEKAQHYKTAYENLRLAGEFSKCIHSTAKECYKTDNKVLEELFFNISDKNPGRTTKTMLLGSFGKEGYKRFDSSFLKCKNKISVKGLFGSEFIFTSDILSEAKRRGASYTVFPSPFSDSLIEAVYIEDTDTLFDTENDFETSIDTSEFLNLPKLNYHKERLQYYLSIHNGILNRATDEFIKASDTHFALEAIYSPAMNFEKINEITDEIITEIERL